MFSGFRCDIFTFFCKFFSDAVETVFWESKAKPSKGFEFNVCYRKHFRNKIWSYLEFKNNCSEPLKNIFLTFLQFFE